MSQTIKTLIVGLSGPSASGKTTLARLLREVFNSTTSTNSDGTKISLFIMHEDDFYKTDAQIPTREITSQTHGTRQVQDWDCVESLNLPLLETTLQHIVQHGSLPADMRSKVDETTADESFVSGDEVAKWQRQITTWWSRIQSTFKSSSWKEIHICVLDGFLLYPPPPSVVNSPDTSSTFSTTSISQLSRLYSILQPLLSLKLFLPSTYDLTITRRAARSGYVTIEGFWSDPPGYVEDVVWPNYARDHGWMFRGQENVDAGVVNHIVTEKEGIKIGPSPGVGGVDAKEDVLQWGVEALQQMVESVLAIED